VLLANWKQILDHISDSFKDTFSAWDHSVDIYRPQNIINKFYINIYTHTHTHRERERDRERIYIYIYIYKFKHIEYVKNRYFHILFF